MRRRMTGRGRAFRVLTGLSLAALMMTTACAQSDRADGGENSEGGGSTFVFGASSDPAVLDPAMASDGETFRVARQIFEGLVGTEPGTADPAPLLAKSWTNTPDGLSYTFELQEGVKFHDGTDFNAAAVCANFDRWYNWTGLQQSENLSYYYQSLFKGFKTSDDPALTPGIYGGCTAASPTQATITLTKPFAGFIQAMSLPAFSMQSPAAMEKYDANNVSGTEDDPRFSSYATEHPTGTGPFMFESWTRGQKVTLKANPDYWGEKAKVDKVVIQTISDGKARNQALQAGEIDGYDLVAPADIAGLKDGGFQVMERPAFNILYLGMNQKTKPLDDIRVRQAIAYALDKTKIIAQSLPEGTEPATQFIPPTVEGYNADVMAYPYDPEKAKALLAEAGATGATLEFNYPTGVSRPYMPSPEDTYVSIKAQLEAVGFVVKPTADKWSPEYLDKIQGSANHGIHLLGWTGDYNDTDNFVGVFFGKESSEWGFNNPELFAALNAARELPTRDQQTPAYLAINAQIMEFLPGVPIASPVPSLAFAPEVKGYEPSPVQDEVWNQVTVG